MASPPLLLRLLTTAVLLVYHSTFAASIQDHELQRSLSVLRSRGYSLFSNAIATSDILDDVVSSQSASTFTFFAPTDGSLYKLDMTGSASEYINTLRCHVITRRMTAVQLRNVKSGSVFESLMKGRGVKVELWRNEFGGDDLITVNGVVLDFPGLYYSHNVAVHGLGGIFNMSGGGELVPRPLAGSPASPMNKSENHTAALPPLGVSIPPDSAPPPEVTGNNNAFISRPLIGGGGELLPPPLAVARLRDPPTSPVNLLENHTAASPPSGELIPRPLAVSPASPSGSPPADAVPPAVTENVDEFTSRRLISGGDSGGSTAVSAEDIAGVMEMLHSDLEKWDGRIFDCLLTDGFGHVSTPRGYLYTRQQSNTSMLSCAGLHQFLHFQHF